MTFDLPSAVLGGAICFGIVWWRMNHSYGLNCQNLGYLIQNIVEASPDEKSRKELLISLAMRLQGVADK